MPTTPPRHPSHYDDEPPPDWTSRKPSLTPTSSRIPVPTRLNNPQTPSRAGSTASSSSRPMSPDSPPLLAALPSPTRASIAPVRSSISSIQRASYSSTSTSSGPVSPPPAPNLPLPARASITTPAETPSTRPSISNSTRPSLSGSTTGGTRVLTGRPSFAHRPSIALSPSRPIASSVLSSAAIASAGVVPPAPVPIALPSESPKGSPNLADIDRFRNDSIPLTPSRAFSATALPSGSPLNRTPMRGPGQLWPSRSNNASPAPTAPTSPVSIAPRSNSTQTLDLPSIDLALTDTPRKPLPAAVPAPYPGRRGSSASQLRAGIPSASSVRSVPTSQTASPARIPAAKIQRNDSLSSAGSIDHSARAMRNESWSSLPDSIEPVAAPPPRPSRSPSRSGPSGPPPAIPPAALLAPERPSLHTTDSTEPLIRQSSPSPSPGGILDDPFIERVAIREISSHESLRRGSLSSDEGDEKKAPVPPKIHVNSLPTSPANGTQPTFGNLSSTTLDITSPAHTTYQPSHAGSLARVHTLDSEFGGISASASAMSFKNSTVASRRSNRAQLGKSPRAKKRMERMTNSSGKVPQLRKPFQSTRLKGEIYKPWLEKKDPAQRWARWITITSFILGFAIMGVLCWSGYQSVPRIGNTCLVLNDDFSSGTINPDYWTHEVRLDGYGHGEFEWSTASPNNSFVQDGTLYLVPTLTSDVLTDAQVMNGYTLNLTADGTCTSNNVSQCVAVSNSSRLEVINPVRSARLTTKNSVNLRYGRVEVLAKLPTGDWLWPQITMVSLNNTYGDWPRSGEIDILAARGNNASYPTRGVDYVESQLHWGPTVDLDRAWATWGYREQRRVYYNQEYHKFGLEWNDEYMWTYIDTRVTQVMSLRFNSQSFWQRGNFPSTVTNMTTGDITKLTNPWIGSSNNNAPFDQPFYLAISLGVGGIDGWFPDGEGGKPWIDDSGTAMSDFNIAKERWWNSWPSDPTKRGFGIKSVKMWKTC